MNSLSAINSQIIKCVYKFHIKSILSIQSWPYEFCLNMKKKYFDWENSQLITRKSWSLNVHGEPDKRTQCASTNIAFLCTWCHSSDAQKYFLQQKLFESTTLRNVIFFLINTFNIWQYFTKVFRWKNYHKHIVTLIKNTFEV